MPPSASTGSVLPVRRVANSGQPIPGDSGWVGVGSTGPSKGIEFGGAATFLGFAGNTDVCLFI